MSLLQTLNNFFSKGAPRIQFTLKRLGTNNVYEERQQDKAPRGTAAFGESVGRYMGVLYTIFVTSIKI